MKNISWDCIDLTKKNADFLPCFNAQKSRNRSRPNGTDQRMTLLGRRLKALKSWQQFWLTHFLRYDRFGRNFA